MNYELSQPDKKEDDIFEVETNDRNSEDSKKTYGMGDYQSYGQLESLRKILHAYLGEEWEHVNIVKSNV